jgi:GNAT superfamily N-acetyltransferase
MPGRLAVSENHRNQGLGEFLLLDALKQSLISSGVIGSTMVVVDPKNESAARFYQRYGFQPIQENGHTAGCRQWLVVTRDTVSHGILDSVLAECAAAD